MQRDGRQTAGLSWLSLAKRLVPRRLGLREACGKSKSRLIGIWREFLPGLAPSFFLFLRAAALEASRHRKKDAPICLARGRNRYIREISEALRDSSSWPLLCPPRRIEPLLGSASDFAEPRRALENVYAGCLILLNSDC